MKEVFLATDFSKYSENALTEAKTLADALNIPLKIIHVFEEHTQSPGPYHSMPGASSLYMQKYIDEARDNCRKALEGLCQKLDVKDFYFLQGSPAKKLVEFIKENNVELLVLGSHGYGILDRMLIGSVADYIVRHAECSIWMVKPKADE